ncbi:MAG: VTT domain-containing protein [Anaerolineae bacterium]|nr:VTT domain-containing protein [Anaerolineae bacterium]
MTELNLTDLFLTGVIVYGAPAFGLALLLGAFGLPLPGSLLVIAAGAFVRQGVLDGWLALILGLGGALLGDSLSYGLGRVAKAWVQARFEQASVWRRAQTTFNRQGGLTVYLTRFLLTPLAIPVNLIAGGSSYSFWRFLAYAAAGEATWLVLYGGLGYIFGSQWELISQFVSDFSGVLVGIVALGTGIYFLLYRQHRRWLAYFGYAR